MFDLKTMEVKFLKHDYIGDAPTKPGDVFKVMFFGYETEFVVTQMIGNGACMAKVK